MPLHLPPSLRSTTTTSIQDAVVSLQPPSSQQQQQQQRAVSTLQYNIKRRIDSQPQRKHDAYSSCSITGSRSCNAFCYDSRTLVRHITDQSTIVSSTATDIGEAALSIPESSDGAYTNETTETFPPTTSTGITIPESFFDDLQNAALWQPNKYDWNIQQCRILVAKYDGYLKRLMAEKREQKEEQTGGHSQLQEQQPCDSIGRLLSADIVIVAFKVLIKCKVDTPTDLAANVRQWERYIGHLGKTPLTDHISLRLLTANAKSGNLGRCLSLLELRAQKQYPTRDREFLYTVTAVQIAAGQRGTKNPYVPEIDQPILDNPTRWLDAILIHMKQRQHPLTKAIAMRMLQCYAGTGYSGKASHHFYRVARTPTTRDGKSTNAVWNATTSTTSDGNNNSDSNNIADDTTETQQQFHRPRDWFYVPELGRHKYQETQVKLHYSRVIPPFFKIPAQVQGKLMYRASDPPDAPGMLRIDRETEPDYSIPLASAFAFAHSLQQGACGHEPVLFNVECYNALIKACVYRGALWRAMNVLDTVIRNATDDDGVPLRPNHISYNLVLAGLARVGDVVTAQKYYHKMLNEDNLVPDAFTVRAIVDGLLNLADSPAAVTVVQDFFNQHSVLPPYTTHCKILEFCLGHGMIYEAKRYVYFIQQLWYWKPVENYHSKKFIQLMRATQHNTQLQKPALQKLFAYFGETLSDSDFI